VRGVALIEENSLPHKDWRRVNRTKWKEDLRSTRDDTPLSPTIEITLSPTEEMMQCLHAMEEGMMMSQQNLQYLLEEMTKLQARVEQPSVPVPMT
jgi:DNA mismatch repair ATPase MutL